MAVRTEIAVPPRVACSHCGLEVPQGLVTPGSERQFCCNGCRGAYELISSCRLEDYYQQRGELEAEGAAPARASGLRYLEFDDPAFSALYVKPAGSGLASVELLLEGVHCAACVWLLEKLPRVVPGVVESVLNFRRATLRVLFDPTSVSVSAIARAIDTLGYRPHPAKDRAAESLRRREDHRQLVRIGVAALCAGNVMVLAFALYGGVFGGIQPIYEQLFRWLSMALGAVCLAWPGAVFFRGAVAAIRTRTPNLDLPIAIALAAGGVMGTVNTVLARGEIYFDSVTAIVFLLLIGRFIQHRQQRWASDAVELLFSLVPTRARLVAEGDQARIVPVESLSPGDLVEVHPGESAPADGVVERGGSMVDESILTGESRPVEVVPGSRLSAGTVNLSGVLRLRVAATGRETRVGRIMELVEACARRRPGISRFTDRVARWFVPGVLLLAATTLVIWLRLEPTRAIDHAAAMLIVTCPCMLGLAAPLVMATSIGRAARRGILIKGADVLERLSTPGHIVLDKTGTLTRGRLRVVRWMGEASLAGPVAALERVATHPIARALVEHGEALDDAARHNPESMIQTHGGGIEGEVGGQRLAVGSRRFMEALGIVIGADAGAWEAAAAREALTPVMVATEGRVRAVVALGDELRHDAREAVQRLLAMGWQVSVLSGDHQAAVDGVVSALGLPAQSGTGGATPEAKLETIEAMQKDGRGPVVMVGDGVNDAAALAAAGVGIAVRGGAEASLSAADVYLSRAGLGGIVELFESCRRAMRTIRLTLWASLVYNVVAAGFTLAGQIEPWIAAIIMPLNSITVTLIAVNTSAFKPREGER